MIRRSAQSLDDLLAIWTYLADRDEQAADRLVDAVEVRLTKLEQHPRTGSPRPRLGRDVRSVAIGRYLLLCRPIEEGVQLLRILHGARDLSRVPFD